MTNEDRPWEFI